MQVWPFIFNSSLSIPILFVQVAMRGSRKDIQTPSLDFEVHNNILMGTIYLSFHEILVYTLSDLGYVQ